MILQARAVRKPRAPQRCSDCGRRIEGPHIYLYGMADIGDRPWSLRYCPRCIEAAPSNDEPKLVVALAAYKEITHP